MRAVELLRLRPGDHVVDLGCGTGLSFPLLQDKIGPEGRLIGVDLTPEMLAVAKERVDRSGWTNVELVQADISTYEFPEAISGVVAVGAFGYVAEFEPVIKKASHAPFISHKNEFIAALTDQLCSEIKTNEKAVIFKMSVRLCNVLRVLIVK